MRRLFNRHSHQPEPTLCAAAVAEGMQVFAADLLAGDTDALDCLAGRAELPSRPKDWADYPNSLGRRARIAYFGQTGPGAIPAADYDRLLHELAGQTPNTSDSTITGAQPGHADGNVHPPHKR
ncbi:hypothetical protein [Streptomyces sp. MN13]